jgi:transposase-like protein
VIGPSLAQTLSMTPECPNTFCTKAFIVKDGKFYRQSESRMIQRFKCNSCGKKFSHATGTLEFRQKKRRINTKLRDLLCSSVSMRRCARLLKVHRTTIERKVNYLAQKAQLNQTQFLKSIRGTVTHMQFDDLITIEHTKMKPLTVSIATDTNKRFILGAQVASIGAFGHLAERSQRKYGPRPNHHMKALGELFTEIQQALTKHALIESDEHNFYPPVVRRFFPKAHHKTYPGGRGAVAGQGELKKLQYDPLFMINHTCAMLRANINRLIRKTWCTTKKPDMLQKHLLIYINFYNQSYLRA